jgi:ribosomal protein L32
VHATTTLTHTESEKETKQRKRFHRSTLRDGFKKAEQIA